MQDLRDDLRIGLHSPAVFLRDYGKPVCILIVLGFFSLMAYGGTLHGLGVFFYIGLTMAAGLWIPQLLRTKLDEPSTCQKFFMSSIVVAQLILGGIFVDVVFYRLFNGIAL